MIRALWRGFIVNIAIGLVIIAITCVLMCLVNLSERMLLGPASDDEDPDAGQ